MSVSTTPTALVAIRAAGSKPPVYCVHAQSGHLRLYHNLSRYLDADRPIYGIRGVLLNDSPTSAYRRFDDMARRYIQEIRALHPSGPYLLLGECDGAELAYEMAQQLRALGHDVSLLALVDSFAPSGPRLRWFATRATYRLADQLRMVGFHLSTLRALDRQSRVEYVKARLVRILDRAALTIPGRRRDTSTELIRRQGFRQALHDYEPAPYDGRVAIVHGSELPWGVERTADLGWRGLVGNLEVAELPGYFGTSLLEPTVRALADTLGSLLDG